MVECVEKKHALLQIKFQKHSNRKMSLTRKQIGIITQSVICYPLLNQSLDLP